MKLQIGNFHVKDIVFGPETSYKDGILTVNKEEALACLDPKDKLTNMDIYIVHPGDSVRIAPVKNSVEPRFRPDGRASYPGYTGPLKPAGDGVVYALKGMTVLASGKYSSMGDSIVDMSGLGAKYTHLAQNVNLVVYAERKEERDLELTMRVEDEQRRAAFLLADYVAKAVANQEPEDWEEYDLAPGAEEAKAKGLPRVALFMTIVSQLASGINEMIYGQDCHNMLPVFLHPNEVLDDVLITGETSGTCASTDSFQNHAVIKRLYAEHGKTINFVGVVAVPADVSDNMKLTNKFCAGTLATALELDGAIVEEYGGGSNIDVDYFYILAELEDRGIKTTGIACESVGKMMVDPKADALVSGGELGEVIELPAMDKVIGDIQSITRDYYFGAWTEHDEYGPSLRPDGSLIVNSFIISHGGNMTGRTTGAVREY